MSGVDRRVLSEAELDLLCGDCGDHRFTKAVVVRGRVRFACTACGSTWRPRKVDHWRELNLQQRGAVPANVTALPGVTLRRLS